MQSLLITLVILVAILMLVFLVIPDRLEKRARRNQEARQAIAEELDAIAADTADLDQTLAPYGACQSSAYAARAQAIGQQVSQLQRDQQALQRQIAGLRLPAIPTLVLPVQHFLLAPADATAVFADTTRVRRLDRAVRAAGAGNDAVRAALEDLAAVPAQSRAESQTLLRRLDAVMAALRVEQRAGIGQLEELAEDLAAQQKLVAELEQRCHNRTPLAELDRAALQLETAAARTAELETRVAELNRARLQLDRRLQETATELDDVQVNVKGGAEPTPATRPTKAALLQAAQILNEAAPEARRQHDFARANDLVTTAHQLIGLGRNLAESEKQLVYLEAHDAGLGYGPDIAAARRELAGLMLRLSPSVSSSEAMGALAASPELPELASRSADLHHELSSLVQRQREALAQLERDAVAERDRLVAAWEEGQRLLPLAAEDPLVGQYQRLLAQFTAARGDPTALQAARKDAAAFLTAQRQWTERLATHQQWLTSFRTELPRLVDGAMVEAQGWACLQPHVTAIKQRVADFSQLRARYGRARTTGEALAAMEQFERLESDVRREYDLLADRAAHLRWLADDLEKTLALVMAGEDEAAAPRRARAQQMIDHRVAQAHAATRYEDATQAMLWAAELAQNLTN